MKHKIKIFDSLFGHVSYSTLYQESTTMEWERSNILSSDTVIFTDQDLQRSGTYAKKIAWLLESMEVTPGAYDWIRNNNHLFDNVLTYNQEFLDRGENFLFAPVGGCWIKPEDQRLYIKTQLLSIIASAKKNTLGQKIRHQIIQDFPQLDLYGRGYNPIDYKLDALQTYHFSIVVENSNRNWYFTEKLIDCFRTGTVPVYWGCPDIGKFFNLEGMIIFQTLGELRLKIEQLTPALYQTMLPAIQDNFERANKFIIAEDYLYQILKNHNLI